MRASQELLSEAPGAFQVHQLNAEALEAQGRWDEAAQEYEAIVQSSPDLPGIHFRLGRLLLSREPPAADQLEKARAQFEAEIKINPQHAGAEFVLGELARRDDKFPDAIAHFSRAVKYDAGNADAHLGLGRSLLSAGLYKDAIPPLETAAKLQPANPESHFQLATAYAGMAARSTPLVRRRSIRRCLRVRNSGAMRSRRVCAVPATLRFWWP